MGGGRVEEFSGGGENEQGANWVTSTRDGEIEDAHSGNLFIRKFVVYGDDQRVIDGDETKAEESTLNSIIIQSFDGVINDDIVDMIHFEDDYLVYIDHDNAEEFNK